MTTSDVLPAAPPMTIRPWTRRRRVRFYLASGQVLTFRAVDVKTTTDQGHLVEWRAWGVRGRRRPLHVDPSTIVAVDFGPKRWVG